MGKPNFSDEFKRDAVAQITERGYPVAEVLQRLGVSAYSLYTWRRQLAKVVSGDAGKDAEIRQLKRELARVTEERDIRHLSLFDSPPHLPKQADGKSSISIARPSAILP